MLRLIFFAQAIVYLILMPSAHAFMDIYYRPPIVYSFIALAGLILGYIIAFRVNNKEDYFYQNNQENIEIYVPRQAIVFGFAALAVIYCYVSWSNGLLNRRQGSEVMADIYGNLPLIELIILRVYEISIIPIAVIYFFGKSKIVTKIFIFLIILFSLPFSGIEDSRGRLIVLLVFILSFVKMKEFIKFFYKNVKIYILLLLSTSVFVYTSMQRLSGYARSEDFLYYEIVRRLDGLNLLTELRDFGFIKTFGTFDFNMLNPLISRIPFIEAGRIAKIEGITSTKQYYLKTLFASGRIDESNSIITDPIYFSGMIGLFFFIFSLGFAISKFDKFINEDKLFQNRIRISLALSFVTSFAIFEVDLFGAFTTFIQNIIIIYPLVFMILYKPISKI